MGARSECSLRSCDKSRDDVSWDAVPDLSEDMLDLRSASVLGESLSLVFSFDDVAIQFRETLMGEKGWSLLMLVRLKVCGVMLMALRDTLCRAAVKESPDTDRTLADGNSEKRGDLLSMGVSDI